MENPTQKKNFFTSQTHVWQTYPTIPSTFLNLSISRAKLQAYSPTVEDFESWGTRLFNVLSHNLANKGIHISSQKKRD